MESNELLFTCISTYIFLCIALTIGVLLIEFVPYWFRDTKLHIKDAFLYLYFWYLIFFCMMVVIYIVCYLFMPERRVTDELWHNVLVYLFMGYN